MRKAINLFNRVLVALVLCAGLVVIGCKKESIGEIKVMEKEESAVTATTAVFTGQLEVSESELASTKVTVYYSDEEELDKSSAESVETAEFNAQKNFTIELSGLKYGTKYNYCLVVEVGTEIKYENAAEFTTADVVTEISVDESSITATTASFSGTVTGLSEIDKSSIQVGMAYSLVSGDFQSNDNIKVASGEISEDGALSISVDNLTYLTKYYYCSYVKQNDNYTYGEIKEFETPYITMNTPSDATDLSASSTANCYIVSQSGKYCFKIYKGNSSDFIGRGEDVPQGYPSSAEVLWESFGTSTAPSVGDLVKNVNYKNGYIVFEATEKKGNAVIAAKDASGKILWSWHIWLTDQPQAQVYNNNAGTMMDRNLGATSATPGDIGALGLLYQWGRKDPFLGSSSISSNTVASSTLTWPSVVKSTSSTGTIDYVTANPTTFVTLNSNNYDWYCTGSSSTDDTRWQSSKTIYDPCPPGWRVPDCGDDGVWSTALGSSSSFDYTYNSSNEGMNFSGKFGTASAIWYPASGYRIYSVGGLSDVGSSGSYWSVTPLGNRACYLRFYSDGFVLPSGSNYRAYGQSVRCLQVIDEVAEP